MRARYKGDGTVDDDGKPVPTRVFGQEFPVGKWAEIHLPPSQARKLSGNPAFDFEGADSLPPEPVAVGPEPEPDPEADEDPVPAPPPVVPADPLDLDGDGHKGGSLPGSAPVSEEVLALRAKLDGLKVKYHHMAGVPKLSALLAEHSAG